MLVYIIILIIEMLTGVLFSVNKNNKRRNIYLIFSFCILALVAGLRTENVGRDSMQYYNAYRRIGWYSSLFTAFQTERYEYGFIILCSILNKISTNPQLLLFVTSIFINFSVIRFIKRNSEDVVFSIFLYITLNFYFSYLNIMRQAIAIAFLLFAYEFMKEKKYIRYGLFIFLGIMFHSSAILGILFIVMDKFKYSKKYNKYIIPVIVIAFLFGNRIFGFLIRLSSRLGDYSSTEYGQAYLNTFFLFLIYFVNLSFGIYILNRKHPDEYDKFKLLQKMMIINSLFAIMVIRVGIFYRFVPYFSIFNIIWLPNILSIVEKKKDRLIYYYIFLLVYSLFWILTMKYKPGWYGVFPYEICTIDM